MTPQKAQILTATLRRPTMYMREVTLSNALMLTLGFEFATAENNDYFLDEFKPWLAKHSGIDNTLPWEDIVEKSTADMLNEIEKVAKFVELLDAYFQEIYSEY